MFISEIRSWILAPNICPTFHVPSYRRWYQQVYDVHYCVRVGFQTFRQPFASTCMEHEVSWCYSVVECFPVETPDKQTRSLLYWCNNSLLPKVVRKCLAISHFKLNDGMIENMTVSHMFMFIEKDFWIAFWGRHLRSSAYKYIQPYQKVYRRYANIVFHLYRWITFPDRIIWDAKIAYGTTSMQWPNYGAMSILVFYRTHIFCLATVDNFVTISVGYHRDVLL
jgi:hypothetical protein